MLEKLPILKDDGLATPEVGLWAEYKYRLVWNYAKMFAASMKVKWDSRVYIDLYAGAGRSRIENTKTIVPASPLLAMNILSKFDKYIFCENDKERMQALKARVKRDYPDSDVSFIETDVNKKVEEVISNIPKHYKEFKVLTFCFVDPFNLKNLKFQTIRKLAEKYIDFLILIPSGMDANRNISHYIDESNTAVEDFTGASQWRDEWRLEEAKGENFGFFFADLFGRQMRTLTYFYEGLTDMAHVRSTEKNLLLYHLAFFSRNELGRKFWKEARKYSDDQLDLL
jgi:three-Cys-motif partner protein